MYTVQVCWPGHGRRPYRPTRQHEDHSYYSWYQDDPEGNHKPFTDTVEVRLDSLKMCWLNWTTFLKSSWSNQTHFRCHRALQLLHLADLFVFLFPPHGPMTKPSSLGLAEPKVCQGSEWIIKVKHWREKKDLVDSCRARDRNSSVDELE